MDKDIRFTGYTAVPSDYECSDGELTQCHNLINEDGAYKSLLSPKVLINLGENYKVIFIHKTSAYTHYIVQDTTSNALYFMNKGAQAFDTSKSLGYFYNLSHINSVGNTLLVFTNESINYFLWKQNKYISLGNHLPNIEVSFGLRGKPVLWSMTKENETATSERSTFNISFDGIGSDSLYEVWSESNQTKITSQIMAKVNKFLSEESIQKGRFVLPFFVRYALRLYDGSLVCHSAPILMNPTTKAAPVVFWKHAWGKKSYTDAECDIMLVSAMLDYIVANDSQQDYTKLKNWSDIIKSIDVFVSKPIYTYDQGGYCKSFSDTDNFDTKFIGTLDFDGFSTSRKANHILLPLALNGKKQDTSSPNGKNSEFGTKYVEWPFKTLYGLYFSSDRTYPGMTINLPEYTDDKNVENLRNVQNFYLLKTIDIADALKDERTDIVVDKEYLQSLTSREVMQDDYLTHDRLIAESSQNFNSRLNLSGLQRELFRGFTMASMVQYANSKQPQIWNNGTAWIFKNEYQDTIKALYNDSLPSGLSVVEFNPLSYCQISVSVYIKENGEVHRVSAGGNEYLTYFLSDKTYKTQEDLNNKRNAILTRHSWGCYFFYPNVNAFKMVISDWGGSYEIELKPHDFLNGAYAVLPYEMTREAKVTSTQVTKWDAIVDIPNKIYTSEVNNPFFFPVTGINTVGTGKILGISTAAKALSQGQFGQFPLYAFTDEGVWALEVNASGGYSAKQPITRDVCISADSITQIDSAVLFATDRGIMEISGSQTMCITDLINGDDFFPLDRLPGLAKLYPEGLPQIDCTFAEFRKDARMTYDYINQRIIMFNANKNYAYVYSMKSKLWGIVSSSLISAVNSYPDAFAMAKVGTDNCLVDLSRSTETHAKGLLVTRPIKLDVGSMLKTFDTVFLRGLFGKGKVQVVLYGSRDNINWHLIHSAKEHYLRGFRGTPYKYFRIVAITDLSIGETLLGASVQYTPRLTNQMR